MLEKHKVVFSVELNRLYFAFKTNMGKPQKYYQEKKKEKKKLWNQFKTIFMQSKTAVKVK